jgi:hypothetical protein
MVGAGKNESYAVKNGKRICAVVTRDPGSTVLVLLKQEGVCMQTKQTMEER